MKNKMNVVGIRYTSTIDWPGHLCSVIHLAGCNMKCPTCHNPTVAWRPHEIDFITDAELETYIKGSLAPSVTITGGEPTESPTLIPLVKRIRETGKKIKLDTNGTNSELVIDMLTAGVIDAVACDIKGPYRFYPRLTGNTYSPERIEFEISSLIQYAAIYPERIYFRTTAVPQLDTLDIDKWIKTILPENVTWYKQEYIDPNIRR